MACMLICAFIFTQYNVMKNLVEGLSEKFFKLNWYDNSKIFVYLGYYLISKTGLVCLMYIMGRILTKACVESNGSYVLSSKSKSTGLNNR